MRLALAIAALIVTVSGGIATAQTVVRAPAVTVAEANAARAAAGRAGLAPAPRRGLRWNDSGRWGLNFNLSQPVGREAVWGDVEAGAYYRVNPSLRVGASAGLSAPAGDPARAPETDRRTQPRVRLESIFKF